MSEKSVHNRPKMHVVFDADQSIDAETVLVEYEGALCLTTRERMSRVQQIEKQNILLKTQIKELQKEIRVKKRECAEALNTVQRLRERYAKFGSEMGKGRQGILTKANKAMIRWSVEKGRTIQSAFDYLVKKQGFAGVYETVRRAYNGIKNRMET